MTFEQLCSFLIVCFFICRVASNECRHETKCGMCIQRNGTCSWCLSPDFRGSSRCESKGTLLREGCSESLIYQSVNEAHLQKNRRVSKKKLLQPQRVVLQLVPNTGFVLSVKGYLSQKGKDERLGGAISLVVNAPRPLKVTMKSDCNRKYRYPIETSSCHGIRNSQVTFYFTINAESCYQRKKAIKVQVEGERKLQMVIYVKTKCKCNCQLKKPTNNNKFHCNGNGKLICGQCECDKETHGRNCECLRSQPVNEQACIEPGKRFVCSGHGNCRCGQCECQPDISGNNRFTGRFCECDSMGCRKFNRSVCGGSQRGRCVCGQCQCNQGYQGEACGTDMHTLNCLSPNRQLCSGRGSCINNSCQCQSSFFGKTCEITMELERDLTVHCIEGGTTDVCSSRGECIQGNCVCRRKLGTSDRYSGRYCECDDFSCDYHYGKICGGIKRGICDCGQCQCREDFGGEACQNDLRSDACMARNGMLCNNQGVCINNACRCTEPYRGVTCEDCPTCQDICGQMKQCVLCRVFGTGDLSFERCMKCRPIYLVDSLDERSSNRSIRMCTYIDGSDNCRFDFGYEQGNDYQIKIYAIRNKQCRV